MYIITNEMEIINTALFTNDYSGCEWAASVEAEMMEAVYMAEINAEAAPVVPMFTETNPAQPAAISPYMGEMVKNQDAVFFALSELNTLMLNAGFPGLRSDIKAIACGIIEKAGIMEETKAGYRDMLEAAEMNAAMYFNQPAPERKPIVTPFKRKYETAAEISRHLASTSLLKEIASLYYVNAEMIEASAELAQAFTDRKASIMRTNKQAA